MNDYKEIARLMCGVASWEDIPVSARDHLTMTDGLCKRLGGGLVSRQVIGMILAPHLMPIKTPFCDSDPWNTKNLIELDALATEEPK